MGIGKIRNSCAHRKRISLPYYLYFMFRMDALYISNTEVTLLEVASVQHKNKHAFDVTKYQD
jgi:hypothetical protein